MSEKKITIAIPTYNRNHILRQSLVHLLPQLTEECQVLIVDNCSDVPVAETLAEILAGFPSVACRIVRNRVNIGGNANILRCFELSDSDWVWLLGDDDQVFSDAIDTILRHIDQYSSSTVINFYFQELPYVRQETFATLGIDEFVEKMDWFDNVMFGSCSVFRVDNILGQMRIGLQYAYASAPHVALLLASIGEKGVGCFSRDSVIVGHTVFTHAQTGSPVTVALGLFMLLEIPMRPATRRALAHKIWAMRDNWNSQWLIFSQVLFESLRLNDAEWAVYIYQQIVSRSSYYRPSVSRRIEARFYLFLLHFPRATYWILSVLYRLMRRRNLGSLYVDRLARM